METASQLWSGDPREALRWLRVAAEGAADAGDDLRSVQLARQAADLRTAANLPPSMPPPAVSPVPVAPRVLSQDPAQTVPATPAASAAAQGGARQANGSADSAAVTEAGGEAVEARSEDGSDAASAPDEAGSPEEVDAAGAASPETGVEPEAAEAASDVASDDAAWDVRTSEDVGQGPISSARAEQETPQAPLAAQEAFGFQSQTEAAEPEPTAAAAAASEQPAPWAGGAADPRTELPTSPGASLELAGAAAGAPPRVSGTFHAMAAGDSEVSATQAPAGGVVRAGDAVAARPVPRVGGGLQPRLRAARANMVTNGTAAPGAFRAGVHSAGEAAASPASSVDSSREPVPYSAPGRFVEHRAVRVSISPVPNASGHFELHPLAEGEQPEPGWKVAVLVALDETERLFPGRG